MITPEEQGPRKLVAIFAADADAAEYSRLMNSDEAATFGFLQAERELAARLIAQAIGRIANTAGDSILVGTCRDACERRAKRGAHGDGEQGEGSLGRGRPL